jgi:hypothetical protein
MLLSTGEHGFVRDKAGDVEPKGLIHIVLLGCVSDTDPSMKPQKQKYNYASQTNVHHPFLLLAYISTITNAETRNKGSST